MKVNEFIKKLQELRPTDDTDITFVFLEPQDGHVDLLTVQDICWSPDCMGLNDIGVVLNPQHITNN